MNETTEVKIEHQEEKAEHKEESKPEVQKAGFNFGKWLKGSNKREHIENISFIVIIVSAIMISAGIGFSVFAQEIIFMSVFGSFLLMVGIVVFIISQFVSD